MLSADFANATTILTDERTRREMGLSVPTLERELLGLLLSDASVPEHLQQQFLEEASADLRPADLDDPLFRVAYERMLRLAAEGSSYDLAMVDAALRPEGCDMTRLWASVNELPHGCNLHRLRQVLDKVKDAAARRQALEYNGELARMAVDPKVSPDQLAQYAQARFRDLESGAAQEESLAELVERYRGQFTQWLEEPGALRGTTTGLAALNRVTRGLRRGHVTIVAARTSVGKTSLMLHVTLSAARNCPAGHQVVVISLEMQAIDLVHRLVSMLSGVDADVIESGRLSPQERAEVARAMEELAVLPIRILDAATTVRRTNGTRGVMTPAEVRRRLLIWRRQGVLDLVCLDYVQLLRVEAELAKLPQTERVAANMQALHEMAMEFSTPILALSQISRETEKRVNHLPQLSDLAESGGIEQTADAVWLLYRADYYRVRGAEVPENLDRPDGVVDVIVAKNRNGRSGKTQIYFDMARQAFYDYDAEQGHVLDAQGRLVRIVR